MIDVNCSSKISFGKESFITKKKNDQGIYWKQIGTESFRDSEEMKN